MLTPGLATQKPHGLIKFCLHSHPTQVGVNTHACPHVVGAMTNTHVLLDMLPAHLPVNSTDIQTPTAIPWLVAAPHLWEGTGTERGFYIMAEGQVYSNDCFSPPQLNGQATMRFGTPSVTCSKI